MLDKDSLNNQISVGVTFASLMAAISLFFTGAIIAQYQSFGPTIKVPLLFLIFSTFSFIFAATIYSNAGSEVTLGKLKTVEKYMIYATNIVEFLGLYPLIISMPLVIGAITDDSFLRMSTTIVALIGMALYSQSRFSILDKQLPGYRKTPYSILIVTMTTLLYMSQMLHQVQQSSYYGIISILLLVVLLMPAIFFSLRSNQYRVIYVRPVKETDIPALAKLAEKYIRHAKLVKLHPHTVQLLQKTTQEKSIRHDAANHTVLVALHGNTRVGFAVLQDNKIANVLSDPEIHRKGVGRMLVDAIETVAADKGYEDVHTTVHAPSDRFFKKLDYIAIDTQDDGCITLQKEL